MREVTFRGKPVNFDPDCHEDPEWIVVDGWIYGYLIGKDVIVGEIVEFEDEYFYTEFWYRVDPATVGQSTGLLDMNGMEIYEGDIVECTHWFFDGNEIEEHFTAHVGFRDGSFTLEGIRSRFYSDYTKEKPGTGTCWIGDINFDESDYKVIGNIYENPELLK